MNASKLLTAGTLALALGACANQPTEVAEQAADQKRNCLHETGTRIEREKGKQDECLGGAGRSYTRDDLERSGGINTSESLRRLGVR